MGEDVRSLVEDLARRAKETAVIMAQLDGTTKERLLLDMAEAVEAAAPRILEANARDVKRAEENGMQVALLDRLRLNNKRIMAMSAGLREVARLADPVGQIEEMKARPTGLRVGRMRVPLGVIGMIYEARPNVTVDAAGLCLKSGNVVILRGGAEAFETNTILVRILQEVLARHEVPEGAVQLIPTADREAVPVLGRLTQYVDVIIARGGEGLMHALEGATVPLFRHGKGVCHTYVDTAADLGMASEVAFNAKVQRPGVCNAMETLLVHRNVASDFLPPFCQRLREAGVEVRGCPEVQRLVPWVVPATEEDWATEYLGLILAIRVVEGFTQAVEHIRTYGSGHSEAIITRDYNTAMHFLQVVDAAAVFVNASTRFNDGGEFGLGAEIGISTQKLHARGPMGVRELTTVKYIVLGNGQIRQ